MRLIVGALTLGALVMATALAQDFSKLDCDGFLSEPDADFDAELLMLFENLEPHLGALVPETTDLDDSGIPDEAELALLVHYLTGQSHDVILTLEAICQFEANKAIWQTDPLRTDFDGVFEDSPNAIPALMSMSPTMNAIFKEYGAQGTYAVIYRPGQVSDRAPFSVSGDADQDGLNNMGEWQNVISSDRRVEDYIQAAAYAGLDGANSLPVTSGATVVLLGLVMAATGLGVLWRRAA